jgi:3-oxoacyl-[acyl-carrier-protein] synthase II
LDTGEGGFRAMKAALQQAKLDIADIDNINCHATSTPVGDVCEVKAIGKLIGGNKEINQKVVVNAIKSSIGHTFGAAGAIESIFAILSIHNVKIPQPFLMRAGDHPQSFELGEPYRGLRVEL